MPIGFDKNAMVNAKKQPAGRQAASSSSGDGTQKKQNHTKQSKVNESTKSKQAKTGTLACLLIVQLLFAIVMLVRESAKLFKKVNS